MLSMELGEVGAPCRDLSARGGGTTVKGLGNGDGWTPETQLQHLCNSVIHGESIEKERKPE